ncbi:2-polyprenyl-6-methoxyphenol hydroxylase [Actinacidiphila yanglinensis]|uniref:2-polyprenyl-6-methoxyphenol hydroxylase n=1 Tax=Actinacidiphila yanglinensis TaxID=310779 RepID=A0A1H6E146_9ACTN|nr:FAD-dependent monooxygenase [Actinacidiphila yanglinensis]SEG91338.1 2-polyprenyl-6-methoxyphenol hydroxylase [Actinacidiphila yanglinensis]
MAPQKTKDGPVIVVGAGPVGLVAAIELARRGVDVRIVDMADGPSAGSRGKGLQPRSIEVMDDLGIAGRILATGRSRLPIRKYRGRTVLGVGEVNPDAGDPTPSTPYPRTLLVPQWRVEEALRERLDELGVRVEYGTELTGVEQDAGNVHATLRTTHGREDRSFAYLVGCDGASSTVRGLLGTGFLGRTDETVRMLTADVELSGLDRDFWHWWPGADGGLLALCPLAASDAFQLQVAVAPDVGTEVPAAGIQKLVEERTGRTDIRVRRVAWQSVWRFNVRMVDRYRTGRVFLVGDAAHVHAPAGGLGMNTGIQDAYNLGWKLAHVLAGAPQTLLDTYEQERLPVAADVLDLSGRLVDGRFKGLVPGEQRGSDTRQLTVHYPVGDLVGSPRQEGAAVQAGDRAPDSLLSRGNGSDVRVFDLLRGTHTSVLAFGPRSAAVAAGLRGHFPAGIRAFDLLGAGVSVPGGGENAFADSAGHARADYAVGGDTLFVIRPDGYVGLRLTDPDRTTVLRYLARLLPAVDTSE